MKKIIYACLLLLSVIACKKDDSFTGERPEEKMAEAMKIYREELVTAPNGWKAYLTPAGGGGYAFYMQFLENDRVKMIGDLTSESASELAESTFRMRAVMAPSLLFDTYSYLHLLADPTPAAFGGEAGQGYKSDFEFEIHKSSGDTLYLVGKKKRSEMILVRATAEEQRKFLAGTLENEIDKVDGFFAENENAYIDFAVESNSSQVQVTIDKRTKRASLTGVLPNGDVTTAAGDFYYGLDGIHIIGDLEYEGVKFEKFVWKGDALIGYDSTGDEYLVSNSVEPILPLHKLLGVKYQGLYSPFKTIFPGTTVSGAEILNYFHNNLENRTTGYAFNYGEIAIVWNLVNERIELLGFSSQNGGSTGWTTTYTYDYTVDNNGVYTFTARSGPAGGYVSSILVKLHEFILNNKVGFDYYVEDGLLFGKMSSVDDSTIGMTFLLIE